MVHFDHQNGTSALKEIQIPETRGLIHPQKVALINKLIYIKERLSTRLGVEEKSPSPHALVLFTYPQIP